MQEIGVKSGDIFEILVIYHYFFEKLYNENYKLNMSIVLSCTNNNFWAVFIDLNLAHK